MLTRQEFHLLTENIFLHTLRAVRMLHYLIAYAARKHQLHVPLHAHTAEFITILAFRSNAFARQQIAYHVSQLEELAEV